jgi:hypothetical protein
LTYHRPPTANNDNYDLLTEAHKIKSKLTLDVVGLQGKQQAGCKAGFVKAIRDSWFEEPDVGIFWTFMLCNSTIRLNIYSEAS